ncbi:MAG: hypothetical protein HY290_30030 [Planctomycetia bacterium]|nr:hypothetical protein [Planctomycetia bacterium]
MSRLAFRVVVALFAGLAFSLPAEAQTIGNSMVGFLNSKLNARVGGGECSDMAAEALRVGGGEFVPYYLGADSPSSGDYVWGTLVTVISYSNKVWSDSNPTAAVQPGDVIQYRNATISKVSYAHHTSVVNTVNTGTSTTASRPTSVFQQNFNKVRTVQSAAIDTTKLTAGWIRIYRPIARQDATNRWQISIVNNASTAQTATIMVGTSTISTLNFTAANTAGSYIRYYCSTDGTLPCVVLSNGQSLFFENAKGDAIYNPTSNSIGIQKLSP